VPQLRRIGDKLVSRERIISAVDEVLALRQAGLSQQEVASRLGIDRSFVSRLESLGEIRKGGSIAVIGLPVANKSEILKVIEDKGIDFAFILDDQERWSFLKGKSGLELFSEAAGLLEKLSGHEAIVLLGHNRPAQILATLLEKRSAIFHLAQVEGQEAHFSPADLADLLERLKG
jgi:transcriptional regulator with XRE-family HTH domain